MTHHILFAYSSDIIGERQCSPAGGTYGHDSKCQRNGVRPGNYVTDGLIDLLKRNDFNFDLPTYFIWEGNTMYLPLASTKNVLTQLRKCVKRFRISFDYMADAVISKTTGDPGITSLVESFANMGAPWLSGIPDVQRLAGELSLNVIENFKTADLCRTYWVGRPMISPIFTFYSICTLGS
jgi:O-methyltransferase involved in polyketide biosynthesis